MKKTHIIRKARKRKAIGKRLHVNFKTRNNGTRTLHMRLKNGPEIDTPKLIEN